MKGLRSDISISIYSNNSTPGGMTIINYLKLSNLISLLFGKDHRFNEINFSLEANSVRNFLINQNGFLTFEKKYYS